MKELMQKKGRAWLSVCGVSLGLHYLVIFLAWILTSSQLSWAGLGQLIHDRLTQPGDAVRYLDIAQNGYVTQGEDAINLVFYPLYPFLMRLLGYVTGNLGLAGLLISQLSFAAAAVFFYELILLDGDQRMAWDGVLLLNLYPFSMFVMGVFTEGFFLLLTISCLYALRRGKYVAAGAVGFLAALSRTQGMLLIFPAVYEIVVRFCGSEKRKPKWQDLALLLIPGGFVVYLLINYALHGNAFQFLIYEADAPWYQTTQWIGNNLAQHYNMALDYEGLSLIIYWVQLALYFIVLATLFYGLKKQERISYLLYGGVYLGFSYLSGWMISGGRYMLGCVPVLMVLAKLKEGWPRRLMLLAFGLLFFAYSLFYLMGYAIM